MPAPSIDAWLRLGAALVVSAVLHGFLAFGVTLPPASSYEPAPALLARLVEQAPSLVPASPATRQRSMRHAPAAEDVAADGTQSAAPHAGPGGDVAPALPPVALGSIEDTSWYSAMQLDVYPRALQPVEPRYPDRALSERQRGEITLALMIDATGKVHEAQVIEARPQGWFEEAVLAAMEAARFTPAQKDGRDVRSQIVVRVVFDPESPPAGPASVGHGASLSD